jgi:hypothetical protein
MFRHVFMNFVGVYEFPVFQRISYVSFNFTCLCEFPMFFLISYGLENLTYFNVLLPNVFFFSYLTNG